MSDRFDKTQICGGRLPKERPIIVTRIALCAKIAVTMCRLEDRRIQLLPDTVGAGDKASLNALGEHSKVLLRYDQNWHHNLLLFNYQTELKARGIYLHILEEIPLGSIKCCYC